MLVQVRNSALSLFAMTQTPIASLHRLVSDRLHIVKGLLAKAG